MCEDNKYITTKMLEDSTNVCDNGISYKIPHGINSDKPKFCFKCVPNIY